MTIYTIRDIARMSGVSVTTVSRVLNHQPDVSPATREKVERVMAECHFVGNANARHLKQSEPHTVHIILRGLQNSFLNSLAAGIIQHSAGIGFTFVTEYIDESADEFQTALSLCQEKRPAGIIFLGSAVDKRSAAIARLDVPMVFVTADTAGTEVAFASSVTIDDRKMGYEAMQALLELGHTNIAIIGGSRTGTDVFARRYKGAMDAMKEHGLRFDPLHYATTRFALRSGSDAVKKLMAADSGITAVFCMSDLVAMGAIRGLSDMGLSVPEDVSVFGFDGLQGSDYLVPRLSTVVQPIDELASSAVSVLVDMLEHDAPAAHVTVPAVLRLRESAAAPKSRTPHSLSV